MIEMAKWQRELAVFSRVVNTIVLTGNINDQHPVINEHTHTIAAFYPLDLYISKFCQALGYQSIVFYNPIYGFYENNKIAFPVSGVELIDAIVKDYENEVNDKNNYLSAELRNQSDGSRYIYTSCAEDAAHIIELVLSRSDTPVAVVMNYSSRLVARPDDLDNSERSIFMHFQNGALNAKKRRRQNPHTHTDEIIVNQLFLVADKLNDLPAWFYLYNQNIKSIDIPKPDYKTREEVIRKFSNELPDYVSAKTEAKEKYVIKFVGATDGFTVQDIERVFRLTRKWNFNISNIDSAVLLYKHGVYENPWKKLNYERIARAESTIKNRVMGQDYVVKKAVDIIKRAAMGMSDLQSGTTSSKPRGIMFFAGPTGTGKTELAKALTEVVFLDEHNMIRFDMSEYRLEQSDQRLLGAPPGYVGYEAGGQLTNAVREHPFSVLLFDEIEKAHPSILDKFLQILDEGRITDGQGETVYFQDCLIIFTSNLGMTLPSKDDLKVREINVSYENDRDYNVVREKITNGIKHYFNEEIGRPEILNRLGSNILVFNFIREEQVVPIVNKELDNIIANLRLNNHIELIIKDSAKQDLYNFALECLPNGQGGRGIKNMIEEKFVNPLSRLLFDCQTKEGSLVTVERICKDENDQIMVNAVIQ